MKLRWLGMVALAGQCALVGCHQADISTEEAVAKDRLLLTTEEESDHATVIYARQELQVAPNQRDQAPATDGLVYGTPALRAQEHLQAAQMEVKLNEDRLRSISDYMALQSFYKSTSPQ